MTQNDTVLHHMQTLGSITALEAIGVYRIYRLAARIRELRLMGYPIKTERRKDASGKCYARYTMASVRPVTTLGSFIHAHNTFNNVAA